MFNIVLLLLVCATVVTSASFAGDTTKAATVQEVYDKCNDGTAFCVGTFQNNTVGTDCAEDNDCSVLVAYQQTGRNKHRFDVITTNTFGRVSFVTTTSNVDNAVMCQKLNFLQAHVCKMNPKVDSGCPEVQDTEGMSEVTATINNGYAVCSFSLDNVVKFVDVKISLAGDKAYYLYAAYGGNNATIATGYVYSGSHFKKTQAEHIYEKCQFPEASTVCVGSSTDNTDNTNDCVSKRNCHVLTVAEHNGTSRHDFDLVTTDGDGYAAVAFSQDTHMGNDGGIVCKWDHRTDTVKIRKVKLLAGNIQDISDISGVELLPNNHSADGNLTCSFSLANSVTYYDVSVTLASTEEYFVFAAYGPVNGSGVIQEHTGYAISDEPHFRKTPVADIYDKCAEGSSALCIGTSNNDTDGTDCISTMGDCKVLVVYQYTTNGKHRFDLLTRQYNGYAAIGFSQARSPSNEAAIVCQRKTSNSSEIVVNKYNYVAGQFEPVNDVVGVTSITNTITEGHIVCSFTVDDIVRYNDVVRSLAGDKKYYVFGAFGTVTDTGAANPVLGHVGSKEAQFKDLDRYTDYVYTKCLATTSNTMCLYNRDGCAVNRNCKALVVYEYTSEREHSFESITTQVDGYVAVGFSVDMQRGEEGAVVCYKTSSLIYPVSVSKGYVTTTNIQAITDAEGLNVDTREHTEQAVLCSFVLSDLVTVEGHDSISLAGDVGYYLTLEYGTLDGDDKPGDLIDWVSTKNLHFYKPEIALRKAMYEACDTTPTNCIGGYFGDDVTRANSECVGKKDCHFFGVYHQPQTDTDKPLFSLLSDSPSQYIAIAFSDDVILGGDVGVQCIPLQSTYYQLRKIKITLGSNTVLIDTSNYELTSVSVVDSDSLIYCKFTLDRTVSYDNGQYVQFEQGEGYYWFIATGPVRSDDPGSIGPHTGLVNSDVKLFTGPIGNKTLPITKSVHPGINNK